MFPQCHELLLDLQDGVLTITLNRPHKRNAMNSALVDELIAVFAVIENNREIRAVVLRGAGGNFCAGGDISGMLDESQDEAANTQAARNFNRNFGSMITRVNSAPQVVITLLEGAVLGAGLGLACISDIAIADRQAMFAMPETGLGIVPAQIAPFVVARIGLTQARRLALLGERIDGEQAQHLGIAHYLTDSVQSMQDCLASALKKIKRCAPEATAITKKLMLQVGTVEHEALLDWAADRFSAALNSAEGKEGTLAFIQKRQPDWSSISGS